MASIEIPDGLASRIDEMLSDSRYDSREELIEAALRSGLESIESEAKTIGELAELSYELRDRD